MLVREIAFDIGRKLGKKPMTSWLFCAFERALPLHRLARSKHAVAFCHPHPTYQPHVLVVPTTPFPALTNARPDDRQKAALMWEMTQLSQKVTAESDSVWRMVINGGARQEVGQVHGHLIHDEPGSTVDAVAISDPDMQFTGWDQIFRWVKAAQRGPDYGFSVAFHLLAGGTVSASFSESKAG